MQADTLIPRISNPQYLNRYSYVRNLPLTIVDPSGHKDYCLDKFACEDLPQEQITSTPPPTGPIPPKPQESKSGGKTNAGIGRPRQDIPELELMLIAVSVFAETDGQYPEDKIELMIWALFNAYVDPEYDHLTEAIDELKGNLIRKWGYHLTGSDRRSLALEILDLYQNSINNVDFKRVLEMVMDIYLNKWKQGVADPTKGARVFSMATSLQREDEYGKVVNEWANHDELHNWLLTNFETHNGWYPDFTYVITDVFVWDRDDNNALGILVLGNGPMSVGCVPFSNCGLPGWRP